MDSVLKILNERIPYSMNQSVNYKGVCRTAPATPGLIMTDYYQGIKLSESYTSSEIMNSFFNLKKYIL